jgi:16S rRNA G966 N2-methylase RsmD
MAPVQLSVVETELDAVSQWASRIKSAWRESVDGIMTVAGLLADAHRDLKTKPKAWARLTGRRHPQRLPFKWNAAEKLKCVGDDKRLVYHSTQLPPDWRAIYLLTTLTDGELDRFAKEGKINPGMNQARVRAFKRLLRREQEIERAKTVSPEYCINHIAIENVGSELLPDASVDAIITDPAYGPEFLPTFSHLAEFAERTLKPGGWCVIMTGVVYLPDVINRLRTKLEFRWQYIITTPGGANARMGSLALFQGYKPVLLFQKPPIGKIREWWSDVIVAKAGEQNKTLHPWQQSQAVFAELIDRFSVPGDLIVDPFAGSGTTARAALSLGRHFWGCDVDADCALQMAAE